MPDTEHFEKQRLALEIGINALIGAFQNAFGPDGYVTKPDPKHPYRLHGSSGDEPMYSIAKKLDDVIESYGHLQIALGLEPGTEPRYAGAMRALVNPPTSIGDLPDSLN